jgi:hypothetical protein
MWSPGGAMNEFVAAESRSPAPKIRQLFRSGLPGAIKRPSRLP